MGNSRCESHIGQQRMPILHIVVLLASLISAGCTSVERAAPPSPQPVVTTPNEVAAAEPTKPVADAPAKQNPTQSAATQPPAKTFGTTTRAPMPDKKPEATAGTSGKPAANPPLDLPLLEKRLRETGGIGVFTKIALKNQVDDLLNKFRAYYQGRSRITLAELRQPYDMLLLKVLSLLQDSDPNLAHAIVASREAIWGMLTDPNKFATL